MTDAQLATLKADLDAARERLCDVARNVRVFSTAWERAGFYVSTDLMAELDRALAIEGRAKAEWKRARECAGRNELEPE